MVADYVVILAIFVPAMVAWRTSLFRSRELAAKGEGEARSTLKARLARMVAFAMIPLQPLLAPCQPAFWTRLAPGMERARHMLLLGWLAAVGLQGYYCTKLQPTNAAPAIFDENHNLERRVHLKRYAFAEHASTLSDAARAATRIGSADVRLTGRSQPIRQEHRPRTLRSSH